jgi:ferric-dicitrate binding protein FerR (iron transport regulator)
MRKQMGGPPTLRVQEVAMTGPSPSSAPETTAGSILSDESALEREFRSRFTELCDEARGHLGDAAPGAAPRVVEAAFRSAWEERAHISSEAELSAFLHEAVRRAAARELSRRAAAHHLAGSSAAGHHTGHQAGVAAPDVDQSWAHLTRLLHPEASRAEAQAYTERLRHEAAEHVGDLSKPRSWKEPVLIGVIGAAIVLAGMWWMNRAGEAGVITRALASADARTLTSDPGKTGRLTLGDSTRVTLAPGSKLTIPAEFGDDMRAVKIEGAAQFDVAAGHDKPFEVRANNAAIQVAGTTLIVRAYPNDAAVTVQVRNGTATLKVADESRPLAAGSAAVVDTSGLVREPSPPELAQAVNWTERRVTMTNRQLRDVVQEVNRWYGLDIKVPELKALDRMASVDAPLDSMRAAIAQVENSADVTFGYEGQVMVFRTRDTTKAVPAKPAASRRR